MRLRLRDTRRVGAIALLVGLNACAPPHPLAWAARLEPGWLLDGGSGPPWTASFIRPTPPEGRGSHRVITVRVEIEKPRSALSGETLFEVNCENDQSRVLEYVLYSQHNLGGVEVERSQVISPWSRAPEDDDTLVAYACADTPEERRAALTRVYAFESKRDRPWPSRVGLNPEE
jgi:hypothetical protein